jgi:outer membrane immunogenic protein
VAVTPAWTGCYAGVNIGYVGGDDDVPFVEGPFAGSSASWNSSPGVPYETIGADDSSAIGGGEFGCGCAVPLDGVSIVIGAAADISALDSTRYAADLDPLCPHSTATLEQQFAIY